MNELSDLLDELESKVEEDDELLHELVEEYNDLFYSMRHLRDKIEKALSE